MKNLHRHKFLFFLNSLFIIMDAAMSIVIAFLLMEIVDIAVEKDLEKIKQVTLFSLVLIIVLIVVGIIERYVQGNYIKKTYTRYKDFIIDKLLKKDLNTFRTSNTGDYISVINNDIKVIEVDYTVNSFALIKQFNLEDTTGIVITHKLNQNILERYDEIFVMDKGTIVESGTFESLMTKQGIFYSMYNVSNLA